jgi:hypothetical protein
LEASVVDVDDIWGKGDRFMSEVGEETKYGNRTM